MVHCVDCRSFGLRNTGVHERSLVVINGSGLALLFDTKSPGQCRPCRQVFRVNGANKKSFEDFTVCNMPSPLRSAILRSSSHDMVAGRTFLEKTLDSGRLPVRSKPSASCSTRSASPIEESIDLCVRRGFSRRTGCKRQSL